MCCEIIRPRRGRCKAADLRIVIPRRIRSEDQGRHDILWQWRGQRRLGYSMELFWRLYQYGFIMIAMHISIFKNQISVLQLAITFSHFLYLISDLNPWGKSSVAQRGCLHDQTRYWLGGAALELSTAIAWRIGRDGRRTAWLRERAELETFEQDEQQDE